MNRISLPSTETENTSSGDNNNRLQTLLKNLPGMAYRCLNDAHWPMEFVSNGCFELCGYHRHELESQTVLWGDFTHPQEINRVDQIVRSAAELGQPFEVEYRIIARDGNEKWVWERGRVVEVRNDGMAIIEGFITDITQRKISETNLKSTEAFARAVVEAAVEAVITIDNQATIESFNLAAQDMFGYTSSEITGMHCRNLIAVNFFREFDSLFKRCMQIRSTITLQGEFNGSRKNQSRFPLHLSINHIDSELGNKFVILIRDLSSQRDAEKQVNEQRDLLAHVDRLNTLGEMTAGIAHEINQPLSAISMYAQSGLRYLKTNTGPDRLEEILEKLSSQAHRAGAVIERIQKMTGQHESFHKINPCMPMIEEVHKLAELDARLKNFIIVLRLATQLPEIKCDAIQIQQVLLNLLRNGMESMKSAGSKPGSKIILQAENVSAGVKLSIIDCGVGISTQIAKRLFEPFASSKESGMGLGLSISRSIINAHGGSLEFRNNKTGGVTFYFMLPLAVHQPDADVDVDLN